MGGVYCIVLYRALAILIFIVFSFFFFFFPSPPPAKPPLLTAAPIIDITPINTPFPPLRVISVSATKALVRFSVRAKEDEEVKKRNGRNKVFEDGMGRLWLGVGDILRVF